MIIHVYCINIDKNRCYNHLKIYPNVNLTTAFCKTELCLINPSNISEKVKGHEKNHSFGEKKFDIQFSS